MAIQALPRRPFVHNNVDLERQELGVTNPAVFIFVPLLNELVGLVTYKIEPGYLSCA